MLLKLELDSELNALRQEKIQSTEKLPSKLKKEKSRVRQLKLQLKEAIEQRDEQIHSLKNTLRDFKCRLFNEDFEPIFF